MVTPVGASTSTPGRPASTTSDTCLRRRLRRTWNGMTVRPNWTCDRTTSPPLPHLGHVHDRRGHRLALLRVEYLRREEVVLDRAPHLALDVRLLRPLRHGDV